MLRSTLFALAALIPAALNAGAASAAAIAVPLCTGDGVVRIVSVPIGGSAPGRGEQQQPCCAKGCHTGSNRKREMRTN